MVSENILKGINEMLSMKPLSLKDKKFYDFWGIMTLINLLTLPIVIMLVLFKIISPLITPVFSPIFNLIKVIEKYMTIGISNQDLQDYTQKIEHVNNQLLQASRYMINEFMKQNLYMLGLVMLSCLLILGSARLAKEQKIRKFLPIISSVFSSFSLIVFDVRSIYSLIFVLMFLMIIIRYKPLGSMQYINFIRYLLGASYLLEKSYKVVRKETKSKKFDILKNMALTICLLGISYFCLRKIFSSLSASMGLLIVISIFLLIWTNNAQNSTILIFHKFVLYISCVPIVVLYNNALSMSEPFKILSVFVTLFFSIERIFNLSREVKKEIIKELPKDMMLNLG